MEYDRRGAGGPGEEALMSGFDELLSGMREGDLQARDALFETAYRDLHRLAHHRLRDGGRNVLLDTTALVHESYLRLMTGGQLRAEDRRAFFAYAGRVMRSVIVDAVRERQALRRGGDALQITLDTRAMAELPTGVDQILRVDEALAELEKVEPRLAAVVEMRYFGGYSDGEIAEALELTTRTVRRDWNKARMLLSIALKS
jgi:RNA polymerase sigma factor (TIGR02999 family)